MLILDKTTRKFQASGANKSSIAVGAAALGLSIPFGILTAQTLMNPLLGMLVGTSLFTYTILLANMARRQPPLFLKKILRRKHARAPRTITDIAGLRIDFVGDKATLTDQSTDGLIHTRSGELQRLLRVTLPKRNSIEQRSLWLETLFEYLASFKDVRFQAIFPSISDGQNREMILVVSLILSPPTPGKLSLDIPPLVRMQQVLGILLERLIILGSAPKIISSVDVRLLISNELGSLCTRFNLQKDWRHVKNLGWEPSFRDIEIKPTEKNVELGKRKSAAICIDHLPSGSDFTWLATILADLPDASSSIFVSPFISTDPINKFKHAHKYWKHHNGQNYVRMFDIEQKKEDNERGVEAPSNSESQPLANNATLPGKTAHMSFYLRWDSNDDYLLNNEISMSRKFLHSLGIKTSFNQQRQQQLLNWRATLPCAQDPSICKHLIAFVPASKTKLIQ